MDNEQNFSTKISILDDSSTEIYTKLFYKASGGKIHQFGTEMPCPASVNPLSNQEVMTWNTRPMHVQRVRVARIHQRAGNRKHTVSSRFAVRSSAQPFHGYTSEPPSSKMFKEMQPVGAIAIATKAAGELAACARKNSEDDSNVWAALKGTWGVNVDTLKDYIVPDTTRSSLKDLVKFARPGSHMLYGFNSTAPAVATSGGSYRPETISRPLLMDYHKLYLGLRWVGEYMARYASGWKHPGAITAFAPAMTEAELFAPATYAQNMVVKDSTTVPYIFVEAAETTMKFYVGTMDAYGVASRLKAAGSHISVDYNPDMNVEILNQIVKQRTDVKIHLPSNVFEYSPSPSHTEIMRDRKNTFQDQAMARATKLNAMYMSTWRSVSATAFEIMFTSSAFTDNAATLIHYMRRHRRFAVMSNAERKKALSAVAKAIPKDMGFLIYTLLKHLTPNDKVSQKEFLEMVMTIRGEKRVKLNANYSESFIQAVANAEDAEVILGVIQKGYNRANSYVHSTRHLTFRQIPGGSVAAVYEDAIFAYVRKKTAFWVTHYKSRILDSKRIIESTVSRIKTRKGVIKEIKGQFMDTELKKAKIKDMETSIGEIAKMARDSKDAVVTYAYLVDYYKMLTYEVGVDLKVHVKVTAEDYRNLLLKSGLRYVEKRRTWGAELSKVCANWPEVETKLKILSRITDMNNLIDSKLAPKVSWTTLYNTAVKKTKVTENSLTRVLKEFSSNTNEADVTDDDVVVEDSDDEGSDKVAIPKEEYEEMTDLSTYLPHLKVVPKMSDLAMFDNNPYSVLMDSSSSEDSDDADEVFQVNATPTQAAKQKSHVEHVVDEISDESLDSKSTAAYYKDLEEVDNFNLDVNSQLSVHSYNDSVESTSTSAEDKTTEPVKVPPAAIPAAMPTMSFLSPYGVASDAQTNFASQLAAMQGMYTSANTKAVGTNHRQDTFKFTTYLVEAKGFKPDLPRCAKIAQKFSLGTTDTALVGTLADMEKFYQAYIATEASAENPISIALKSVEDDSKVAGDIN